MQPFPSMSLQTHVIYVRTSREHDHKVQWQPFWSLTSADLTHLWWTAMLQIQMFMFNPATRTTIQAQIQGGVTCFGAIGKDHRRWFPWLVPLNLHKLDFICFTGLNHPEGSEDREALLTWLTMRLLNKLTWRQIILKLIEVTWGYRGFCHGVVTMCWEPLSV